MGEASGVCAVRGLNRCGLDRVEGLDFRLFASSAIMSVGMVAYDGMLGAGAEPFNA
jgi:hypothetical protein